MGRLLKLAAFAGFAYLAWEYLKGAKSETGVAGDPAAPATDSPGPPAQARQAPPRANGSRGDGPAASATKAELYKQAQELDIKGRSSMSRDELERAVRAAAAR